MNELLAILRGAPGTGSDGVVAQSLAEGIYVAQFVDVQDEALVVLRGSDIGALQ